MWAFQTSWVSSHLIYHRCITSSPWKLGDCCCIVCCKGGGGGVLWNGREIPAYRNNGRRRWRRDMAGIRCWRILNVVCAVVFIFSNDYNRIGDDGNVWFILWVWVVCCHFGEWGGSPPHDAYYVGKQSRRSCQVCQQKQIAHCETLTHDMTVRELKKPVALPFVFPILSREIRYSTSIRPVVLENKRLRWLGVNLIFVDNGVLW